MNKYMKAAKGLEALEDAVVKATKGFDSETFNTLTIKDAQDHLMAVYRRQRSAVVGDDEKR